MIFCIFEIFDILIFSLWYRGKAQRWDSSFKRWDPSSNSFLQKIFLDMKLIKTNSFLLIPTYHLLNIKIPNIASEMLKHNAALYLSRERNYIKSIVYVQCTFSVTVSNRGISVALLVASQRYCAWLSVTLVSIDISADTDLSVVFVVECIWKIRNC